MTHIRHFFRANIVLLFTLALITFSCKEKTPQQKQVAKQYVKEITKVKVTNAKEGIFYKEILNNGKLSAIQEAEIHFKQEGEIIQVLVNNGQHINEGEIIAKIDDTELKYKMEAAELEFEQAKLDLEANLISSGYSINDTANVPVNIMNVALVKSSYNTILANYEKAKQEYNEAAVIAPFDAIICNLDAKPNNPSSKYDYLCNLIDNSAFEVAFSILETEIQQIKKGLPIALTVTAYNKDTFPGVITSVNPYVDENGMIKVKAKVPNRNDKLIEGMNAQVIVKIEVPHQLIVPKSAVVLCQERKVVFTTRNDTIALWNYVDVINENSKEVCIERNGINPGDKVIIEGNLELGHLTPIRVN